MKALPIDVRLKAYAYVYENLGDFSCYICNLLRNYLEQNDYYLLAYELKRNPDQMEIFFPEFARHKPEGVSWHSPWFPPAELAPRMHILSTCIAEVGILLAKEGKKGIVGKKYRPKDNSYSINLTQSEFKSQLVTSLLAPCLNNKFEVVEATILTEPFEQVVKDFTGTNAPDKRKLMIVIEYNGRTHTTMYFPECVID